LNGIATAEPAVAYSLPLQLTPAVADDVRVGILGIDNFGPVEAAAFESVSESKGSQRHSAGFSGMRNHPEVGKVPGCDVYGGWSVDAPPSDQFTRPLHSIETMYAIMGPGVVSVSSTGTATAATSVSQLPGFTGTAYR
jgi:hypothetical protein